MSVIYTLGHTNPDTDSIATAIALSKFIPNSVPARLGELNPETEFILNKLNIAKPELLENLEGKNLYLIDHSERTQSIESIDRANVLAIIDHHKIGFTTLAPIIYFAKPVGCTSTILAELYFAKAMHLIDCDSSVVLDDKTATLMISAIVSDTLLLKSPTTTALDKKMISELLKYATSIENFESFGMELLKSRSNFEEMTAEQIFNSGAKDFNISGKKISVSQLEVVDPLSLSPYMNDILTFVENKLKVEDYDLILFLATDILNEESFVYSFGEINDFEKAFNCKTENGKVKISKLMSRKKQIIPLLENFYNK